MRNKTVKLVLFEHKRTENDLENKALEFLPIDISDETTFRIGRKIKIPSLKVTLWT